MPVSKVHLKQLDECLKGHEVIVKVGRDKAMLAALNELVDNADVRKTAIKDPMAYLKSKGLALPRGCTITITEGSTQVGIFFRTDHLNVEFGYDSDKGGFRCTFEKRP